MSHCSHRGTGLAHFWVPRTILPREMSPLAEKLLASQEGFCSVGSVISWSRRYGYQSAAERRSTCLLAASLKGSEIGIGLRARLLSETQVHSLCFKVDISKYFPDISKLVLSFKTSCTFDVVKN